MRGWPALFQQDYLRGCPSLSLPVLERQGRGCSSITAPHRNAASILFQNVGASVPLMRGLTPLRCNLLRKSPPKRSLDGPPSKVEMRVIGYFAEKRNFLLCLDTEKISLSNPSGLRT